MEPGAIHVQAMGWAVRRRQSKIIREPRFWIHRLPGQGGDFAGDHSVGVRLSIEFEDLEIC